ncbi:MAG: DUF711 family protein [Immundisolibacter sp.]|uniref:DUF711 family protein n=1 Tax=Immundisolibacter sp. TaxID=1934948 RepID=UPI003D12AF4B
MQVRAVTFFASAATLRDPARLANGGRFAAALKARIEAAGITVQSLRLATPPAQDWLRAPAELPAAAQRLEADAVAAGFKHCAIGTLRAGADQPDWIAQVPAALAGTQWLFCSADLLAATPAAFDASAQAVLAISRLGADGFANLRFAAAYGVPVGAPFFPAATSGKEDGFSIAIEAADVAVDALPGGGDLAVFEARLAARLEQQLAPLATLAEANAGGYRFHGIDCALAPYPQPARSLGTVIEALAGVPLGGAGVLAAVAALRRAVAAARFPRAGFCAPMLIVLEDAGLAAANRAGAFGWGDLLAASAAGSCGPDVVPLPGDVPVARLAAAYADMQAVAQAVRRPLEMRVLPLPGRGVGDATEFSFDYFAPGRVMAL